MSVTWEGVLGDEDCYLNCPGATARREQRKEREIQMRPISKMTSAEIEEYLKVKKLQEEADKHQEIALAKAKLIDATRGILQLGCVLTPDEQAVITSIQHFFGTNK